MIARLVSFLFPLLGYASWLYPSLGRPLASAFFGLFGEAAELEADAQYRADLAREKAAVKLACREVALRADFPVYSPFCETGYPRDRAGLDRLFSYRNERLERLERAYAARICGDR